MKLFVVLVGFGLGYPNPKTSIFMMGWIIFFGKLVLGFLFVFFYITNLLIYKNLKKAPLEIFIYLIENDHNSITIVLTRQSYMAILKR